MFNYLEDHGLPLVQLKEQRRELVVALARHRGPIPSHVVSEIATVQQTIAAVEAVITDLDAEFQSVDHAADGAASQLDLNLPPPRFANS